ncbi:MAG: flagellar basal body rod protein FlgB [Rhodospirillaceae bacterium]|jgi:flagellar basal-body rod protein FlgB|nr:flagellar basal body rod protein FlgB [Rhodospirillaceae bacterium]
MDITNLPMFGAIKERLNWVGQRQQVLSHNIANANTPKYKSRDIEEFDFQRVLRNHSSATRESNQLKRTHRMHLSGHNGSAAANASVKTKSYETSPDGNSVILEEQMVKMNEAAVQHSTMVGLYRKHLSMIKLVVRGR